MSKIAVCVDDNSSSIEAIETAVNFANKTGDSIVVIHSLKSSVDDNKLISKPKSNNYERIEKTIANYIETIEGMLTDEVGVSSEIINDNKDSVQSIVDYVNNDENIEHVFIGHKSLDRKHEKLYGSFAKKIISESPVPVTVSNSK